MKVKMILPALLEAQSQRFRPIKYSLFPPLGLATLAGHLGQEDEMELQDEHVEKLNLSDTPDLVVIQAYITSAYRAYELADHYRSVGAYVCLGGIHPTALPEEASKHADSIFCGPGEDIWPRFLADFRQGNPKPIYQSTRRSLEDIPPVRRDLIKRNLYLVPNTLVVSRGCPHRCDFCYKESFYRGGRSFYTMSADAAIEEIDSLPGKHLFFLDDHLFGNQTFASNLFEGMRGMGRIWQAASTVQSVLQPDLIEKAVASGLRSLFIGFETLNSSNLQSVGKLHNIHRDYEEAIARLRDLGVMINASFVFGLDEDTPDVFDRTTEWAIQQGIETATFHILTPYPGTRLYETLKKQGRILTTDWNLYDTRHAVFRPARMSSAQLEEGYWRAYKTFYKWRNILRASARKESLPMRLRHLMYSGGWKKLEPAWNAVVRFKKLSHTIPLLEKVLSGFGTRNTMPSTPAVNTPPASDSDSQALQNKKRKAS